MNDRRRRSPATRQDGERFSGFGPGALRFLRGLARNNRREWFQDRRAEFDLEVLRPLRALVDEVDVRLARLAPEMIGDPKRSIFRIYRDVRFSADKSPYKTNAACQFFHRDAGRVAGREAAGVGAAFYFQLAPGDSFSAAGLWMPCRSSLARVRDAIADDHERLRRILAEPTFRRRFGSLEREAVLRRMPRGFAENHPAADLLRFQSFTVSRPVTERQLASSRLPDLVARDFAAAAPLVRWLNAALGYPAADRR